MRHAKTSGHPEALVTHRPGVDALTMELVEEGEVIAARIPSSGMLEILTKFKP
jgi:phosphohistidine phosphatase SixA